MAVEKSNEISVFQLITRLCEKYYTNPEELKSARSKCYEILLEKRSVKRKIDFPDLGGTSDPYCNLLSWQFKLIHQYNMRNHAEELANCINNVQDCLAGDNHLFNSVLKFLMNLRNIPKKNTNKLDLSSLPSLEEYEKFNFDKLFKLPDNFNEFNNNLEEISTTGNVHHVKSNIFTENRAFEKEFFNRINLEEAPKRTENIWELASTLKYSERKTWESYGYPQPDKEPPFLSELGPLSSLWVENLQSLYLYKIFKDGAVFKSRLVSRKDFIRDLKYLLVGMASECFSFDENGIFYLIPNISIEAITPDALTNYTRELIFVGTCSKALYKMSTPNLETGRYKHPGYVYTEFCESINRYLKFYQAAIFSISNDTNFLQFLEKTYDLRLQINTLASICKVGPYMRSTETGNAVEILNYLYQKVHSLKNHKVIYVLYSILYSCCQVYLSRFLKPWILEGSLNDPYGEFYINSISKYIASRGRTYWTRGFTFHDRLLPDFLSDLKVDILSCGKAMSLLKFCDHSNKLKFYLMGKKPSIISCCVTSNQLVLLRNNITNYYLDIYKECGPRFSMQNVMFKSQRIDPLLLAAIAKKRAETLNRIKLEKERLILLRNEKKLEEINMLKEQYDMVLALKQHAAAREIEVELNRVEDSLEVELKRQQLLTDEVENMREYYAKIFKIADDKKAKIEKHIQLIKSINIEHIMHKEHPIENVIENEESKDTNSSSGDSYFSTVDDCAVDYKKDEKEEEMLDNTWDVINANIEFSDNNANLPTVPANIQQAIDNFAEARKNKARIMTEELGVVSNTKSLTRPLTASSDTCLTQAQKNKLKMLSSEFGITFKPDVIKAKPITISTINRNKVMRSHDCFDYKLDNEIFQNKNARITENTVHTLGKSKSMNLELEKQPPAICKGDPNRPTPMSVDSTPLSEHPQSPMTTTTGSSMFLSSDAGLMDDCASGPTTGRTCCGEQPFDFNRQEQPYVPASNVFSKRIDEKEAEGVFTNSLGLFLRECVRMPLVTQTKLINEEMLRYFVEDLEYINHLSSLRDFFFIQDGEFGRHITDKLFTRLYEADVPSELINCRILKDLVFDALDMSYKKQKFTSYLSFKINNIPTCFDLGDPNVLDCLSLTYKVDWPLNIVLPSDVITKYDEVFRFLIKLSRVSWVLKKIFLELKVLARETGKKEIYLMSSPQYRKLHQCRHIMAHFVQTLKNYVVGEVLQSNWAKFESKLANVESLDELYETHTEYIKNILFMCLLTQKMIVLKNVINKTFKVILKFYDYLRSRSWRCEGGHFVHPNFHKLEIIFQNFQEFELYMFKVINKVAKSGYHPHLLQLLEMLDVNYYFSTRLKQNSCTSLSR
ncbi:unnamed protein product [Phyllotreta striolata]|uniref:Gamma-tubulin complex component 6 n=1 Tax=Phyllotreta striolata TaxID=444603 RepID=A0A9N9TVH7_PHYSR|nr:unnamed protein product [Phyllotreta striolata]